MSLGRRTFSSNNLIGSAWKVQPVEKWAREVGMNQGRSDAPKKQTLAEYPVLRAENFHIIAAAASFCSTCGTSLSSRRAQAPLPRRSLTRRPSGPLPSFPPLLFLSGDCWFRGRILPLRLTPTGIPPLSSLSQRCPSLGAMWPPLLLWALMASMGGKGLYSPGNLWFESGLTPPLICPS